MAVQPKSVRMDGVFFGWVDGPEDQAVLLAAIQNQNPAAAVATGGEATTPTDQDEPPPDVQTVTV